MDEFNPLYKRWRKGLKRVALVYPNRYVGGISNLGLQYIYHRINLMDGFVCERFYSDVFDGLKSVETSTPLSSFDIALFSIQYEEDVFKAYEILKKSGFSGLKIAGGPCIMENPRPYEKIFDFLYVGELESSSFFDRLQFNDLKDCEGIYSPGKRVKSVRSKLDEHLEMQIIGNSAYGRALLLEIGRGCVRNCRFCIVRRIYFPCRWRDAELLLEVAEKNRKFVDKVALIAPSPSDHPEFREIVFGLADMGFSVSPSSIRADKIDEEIIGVLKASGLRTLTIAPEAGSERLREALNKGIGYEDIIRTSGLAGEYGIEKIKLYFMVGLPGERKEDLDEIVNLAKEVRNSVRRVEISVNPLVPKPHTPFQWLSFGGKLEFRKEDIRELKEKIKYLWKNLRGFEFKAGSVEEFAVQTVISRGKQDVFPLIESGRANSFRNIFRLGLDRYLGSVEEHWSCVDHGYDAKRLRMELERALRIAGIDF